ncbi:MAG: hypothetical protein ACQEQ4_05360 [Fibrobacterota bacterium]
MKKEAKKRKSLCSLFALLVSITVWVIFVDFNRLDDTAMLAGSLIRAVLTGIVFWIVAFIVSDIIIKGVVEDINDDDLDPFEGGMEQHIYNQKKNRHVEVVETKSKEKFQK